MLKARKEMLYQPRKMHETRVAWPYVLRDLDRPNEASARWGNGVFMDNLIVNGLQQQASREESPRYEMDIAAVTEAQSCILPRQTISMKALRVNAKSTNYDGRPFSYLPSASEPDVICCIPVATN